MRNELATVLTACQDRVGHRLDAWLPHATLPPTRLHEAMRYAVLGGGKRIRPLLVYATGQALGLAQETLDNPACAVELIHAYSLVHDDLPAMDDDDLRRGRPTVHRAFDDATAILAGDALQTLAFYLLAHDATLSVAAERRIKMIETLAHASGSRGMCGGQALDLAATGRTLNIAELENMHIHKTGALIRASVALGALGQPDADPATLNLLDRYAKCVGLAFQIRDDILDVEGSTETLGKQHGADAARDKSTYPSLLGLPESKRRARELHEAALDYLQPLDQRADVLRWISEYIVERVS